MYALVLKSILKKTLLFIISIYLSLLIIETFLIYTDLDRRSVYLDLKKIIEKKINKIDYDKRSLVDFYLDYKKINENVVLSTTSTGLNTHIDSTFTLNDGTKVFPLSGISNRETVLCNELGYYSKYKSDQYGFNNTSSWKNEYSYLLIGDSTVEGHCVDEKDNIAGNLQNLLGKKNSVLNLGRGGNGTLKNYAVLKEYIDLIDTKNILYFHTTANDLQDLQVELRNPILKKYYNDKNYSQNLANLQDLIDKNLMFKLDKIVERFVNEKKVIKDKKYYFIKFIKLNRTIRFKNKVLRQLKNKDERSSEFLNEHIFGKLINIEFRNILKSMKNLADERNINFYFVYWPYYYTDPDSYKSNEKVVNLNDQYYSDILSVAADLEIPVINLKQSLFELEKDPLSLIRLRVLGHFNEKGYKLLSKIMLNKIENKK